MKALDLGKAITQPIISTKCAVCSQIKVVNQFSVHFGPLYLATGLFPVSPSTSDWSIRASFSCHPAALSIFVSLQLLLACGLFFEFQTLMREFAKDFTRY